MRGCQRAHIEYFAVGGQSAVEIVAIPGGHPLLPIIDVLLRHIDPPRYSIGFADPVGAAALWHRFPEFDHPGA